MSGRAPHSFEQRNVVQTSKVMILRIKYIYARTGRIKFEFGLINNIRLEAKNRRLKGDENITTLYV